MGYNNIIIRMYRRSKTKSENIFLQELLTSRWCLFQALHCVRIVLADYCSTVSHVIIIEPENELEM